VFFGSGVVLFSEEDAGAWSSGSKFISAEFAGGAAKRRMDSTARKSPAGLLAERFTGTPHHIVRQVGVKSRQ